MNTFLLKFIQRPVAALTIIAMVVGPFSAISFPSSAEAATTIFSDGFETTPDAFSPWTSGNPASGKWTADSSGHSGAKSARAKDTETALYKSQPTTGYENIVLSYWYKADDLEDGQDDKMQVQWSSNGGSTWNTLFTIDDDHDDNQWHQKTHNLSGSADDNADFRFRFKAHLSSANDNVYIDDVSLTGDALPVIPPCDATPETPAFTTFDTFSDGSVNGQNSWSSTGSYDQEVVPNVYGYEELGCKSLRISNAVTSGAFGDQTFAAPVAVAAGESTIATNDHFEAQFDFVSTMLTEQSGLALSVSPDDGNGSRMSYLGFADTASGITVTFYDTTNAGPLPSATTWNPTVVATLDRDQVYTIKFEMDFVDGPANDIVKIYVDGSLVHTGTSWEDYYRYDAEQNGNGNVLFPVDTLIFRAGGTAVPANDGNGFLFDNISLSSSENIYQPTGEILTPTPGETVSGSYEFTATYDDGNEDNDDNVQWAIRQGTCAAGTGTVFGNVDGHNDSFNWDGASFSSTLDTSSLTPGEYCFIFNPTDDVGQNDVRETQTFYVESPITEVRVHIFKYVDGAVATEGTFPMHSSWSADNIGSGSGNYSLNSSGAGTTTPYAAQTAAMSVGADYSTYEVTGGDIAGIGEECPTEGYRLVGYRWGETLDDAEAADLSYDAPDFTDLGSDMYVIVENETCVCDAEASYTIYSNSDTQVNDGDAYEISAHPAWTASIPGASWIWSENINAASQSASVGTSTFTRSFTIDGTPSGATLKIATDNTYAVYVNGNHVANSTSDLNHFAVAETVNIPAMYLLPGENELLIEVNNPTWDGTNPAGLLYALTVELDECTTPQVKVHILKYLYDGETTVMADSESADSFAFPMKSSWSAANIGSGSGSYTLSPSGYATSTVYAADTAAMDYLADYSTYEDTTTGDVLPIGSMCIPGKWRLEGYKVGTTLGEAEAASLQSSAPSFTGLQQDQYVIVVNRDCDTVPTATVAMCKYDTNENPLSGWTLMLKGAHVEDLTVLANNILGADTVNTLYAGVSYIATAVGTWLNSGQTGNYVDAEYSTQDGWTTQMDGFTSYSTDILELQINELFDPASNWGSYSSSHTYAQSFMGADGTANFRVFDGNGTTPVASWYNDNEGSLDVSINYGYAGVTDETGCVVFENVPYGTYTAAEIMKDGWENMSGLGEVEVDEPEETFNVVNHDLSDDTDYPTLTIVKETEGEDGMFEFSISGGISTTTSVTTYEGYGSSEEIMLAVGTSTVTEIVPEGWSFEDSWCEYDSESEVGVSVEYGEEIYLEEGDSITCYFYNEPTGPEEVSQTIVVHHGDLATNAGDVISDPSKWLFYNDENDTIDSSLGAFITGPGSAPLGMGSAQISVTGTERRNLATYGFYGTPLSQITEMQFSTYNPSAGNGGSPDRSGYLVFNVSFDGTDTWQKRLIYVPSVENSITQDSWQTWDAIDGGNALWSWSGLIGHGGSGTEWPDGDTDGYRTWNEIISVFPNIQIRDTDAHLGIRVGEPYADGYTENIDRFLITISDGSVATTTIFDFEPDSGTETVITNATDLETNPSLVNQPFAVEWEVSLTSGPGTPDGTVNVTANGGAGCSAPVEDGGCNITPAVTGSIILQANFVGDPGYDDSSSETVTHEVIDDTPAPTITSSNSDGNLFSFGLGGFGGGGSVLGASTSAQEEFGEQCETYLTAFIKPGGSNDPEQVRRLQYVLSVLEGLDVEQNGIYDAKTIAAVHAFQTKYASEILTPWGISQSTGFVYLTTRKKVNEIYCKGEISFPLTPEELAIIESSKNRQLPSTTGGINQNQKQEEQTTPPTDTPTEETNDEGTGQGASAGSSNGGGSIWDAIRSFFGF